MKLTVTKRLLFVAPPITVTELSTVAVKLNVTVLPNKFKSIASIFKLVEFMTVTIAVDGIVPVIVRVYVGLHVLAQT